MNLVADESVDRQIVEQLRKDDHEVLYTAELEPGISDEVVLERANEKQALLVTADKDFGELVYRQDLIHSGVILIRLAGLSPHSKARTVSETFKKQSAAMKHAFCVISPGMVRIRHEQK